MISSISVPNYMGRMIRTFISIDMPVTDTVKDAIGALRSVRNIRPVSVKQIHITLSFLGDTDENRIPQLEKRLKDVFQGFGAYDITVKGVGTFPNDRNPRVVWMGIDDNERLMLAADNVRSVLDDMNLNYDGKRFSPHITIGRVNGKTDVRDFLNTYRDSIFSKFNCKEIRIMGSELTPKGAIHTVLARIPL